MQLIVSATQHVPDSDREHFDIVSATELGPQRAMLETFIANGFATAFNAQIHHFLPLLVGIQTSGIRAALGIRSGQQTLFIEQYLSHDLALTLHQRGLEVSRHQIAEIGNLFSASSRYTLPLLLAVSTALYANKVEYAVFCATQPLIELLHGNGLTLTHLADADPARLKPSNDNWGSYYATHPQVMALKLGDVVRLMLQQSSLLQIYMKISAQMPAFNQQVRCL